MGLDAGRVNMQAVTRRVDLFLGRVPSWGAYISAGSVAVLFLLVMVEVTARNLFRWSTLLADEVSGYLLVVTFFLGLAYCLKTGGHIYVEMVVDRLGSRVRQVMRLIACAGGAAYTALVTWSSYNLAVDSYRLGATSYALSQSPIFLPQMIVPIGMGLLTLQLLLEALLAARALQRGRGR